MASTPNFNWATPDNTGLVKNGALDIRTLGNAIDASLVDLKGGTTGQVLAKQTNTDMDFTWSTPSSGSSYVAGKNGILNSAMNVAQRGTSIAFGTYVYLLDRWQGYRSAGGATASRQVTGDTTNLPNIQYCMRIQRDSGNGSTNTVQVAQNFETLNSIPFAGKTVTLSFYARKGANYSATSSLLNATVYSGTGTDQQVMAGYTGSNAVINQNATLTTTWQRFSYSGTVPSTATEIAPLFNFSPVGTAGAADYYEITGVQLEIAASASDYSPNQPTYATELAACQRYYYRATSAENQYTRFGTPNGAGSTTSVLLPFPHPVTMRVKPTAVEYGGTYALSDGNGTASISSVGLFQGSSAAQSILDITCSGATQFRPYIFIANGSTSTYIGVTAEL